MSLRFALPCYLLLIAGILSGTAAAATKVVVTKGTTAGTKSTPLNYLEVLPDGYQADSTTSFPAILFLHGYGERKCSDTITTECVSSTETACTKNAILSRANTGTAYLDEKDVVFLCPHAEGWWSSGTLNTFVDYLFEKYNIDPDRFYLTGLSMGGAGAWEYAASYPTRITAMMPVCGASYTPRAWAVQDIPTWAIHSWGDGTVNRLSSIAWTSQMASSRARTCRHVLDDYPHVPNTSSPSQSYKNAAATTMTATFDDEDASWTWEDGIPADGASTLRLTMLTDSTHNKSWETAYNSRAMLDWLLSHQGRIAAAGQRPTPANSALIVDNSGGDATASGSFATATSPSSYWGSNYHLDDDTDGNVFTWTPSLSEAGDYTVYAWFPSRDVKTGAALISAGYEIAHEAGTSTVMVLQNPGIDNAACWVELGTYSFSALGTTSVTLHSTGVAGKLSADALAFVRNVPPPNQAPTANAGLDVEVVDEDGDGLETVILDGSGSSDPDGDPLTFTWRDDDDNLVAEGATTSVLLAVGGHEITLTVSDSEGASAVASITITVLAAPDEPTDPTDPVEPTDPTDPTDPTEPIDPAEPTNPTDPTDPSSPSEPSDPDAATNVGGQLQGCASIGGGESALAPLVLFLLGIRNRRRGPVT